MHQIETKFVKYIIRTFLDENPDTRQKKYFCNSVYVISIFLEVSDNSFTYFLTGALSAPLPPNLSIFQMLNLRGLRKTAKMNSAHRKAHFFSDSFYENIQGNMKIYKGIFLYLN